MRIENSFTVEAPVEQVWTCLTDMRTIASCVPGVTLGEETDGVYSGSVKSKVGPVTAEYRSSARFVERDAARRIAVLDATGLDARNENVRMLVTAQLVAVGERTRVDMHTDVSGTGKIAQLGRGVLKVASEKLLAQFVACFQLTLDQPAPEPSDGPGTGGDGDALDLLHAAGEAVAKRVVPVALLFLLVVAVLLYLI